MRSMTGFGRLTKEINGHRYIIEIKSVNNKYSDISIKMPRSFNFAEEAIKKEVSNIIARGKIDIYISYEEFENYSNTVRINDELANRYIEEIKEIIEKNSIDSNINMTEILTLPEVLKIDRNVDEDTIKEELVQITKEVLEEFASMREKEGKNIKKDLLKRVDKIEKIVGKISNLSSGLIEEYVVKLEKRIEKLLEKDIVDKDRLAQEVVIYADKSSVEEEITRLNSHIKQLRNLFEENVPIGKKLDFIMQEMNRETNTIGSKSGSTEITNLVIEMKVELEDIREQIQNIE